MADYKLDIAITGGSGSGKSTFVNSLRGLKDEDIGSAETGVVEATVCPTPYSYPNYPTVMLWDLPGIGTPAFQPDSYFKQVNFSRYHFFIIVASERFTQCHAMLAREVEKMGRKFYFVRSKVDMDLYASKMRRKSVYNEEKILQEIKQNAIDCLLAEGVESPQVFLTCNFERNEYEFPELLKTLENDIPSLPASVRSW